MDAKKTAPVTYLMIALVFFAILGCEYPVFFIDRIIDGRNISDLFSWAIHWYGAVAHWTITIALWGGASVVFYLYLKKNKRFLELFKFKIDKFALLTLIIVLILVITDGIIEAIADNLAFPQLLSEYYGFKSMYGTFAWLVSIFQNIYYLFESIVVLVMIACFQKAGDLWFRKTHFPWASIGLAFTWGAIHFLSHPAGAMGVFIWSILPGLVYVLSKKSFYATFAVLFLAFII
jgi:hypothetical protein